MCFDVPVCQDGHFFYFLAEWKTAYFTSPLARTGALFLLPCRVEDRLFYVPCLPGRALFFTSLPSGRPLILRPRLPGRSSSVESCCCSLSCFCCSALSAALLLLCASIASRGGKRQAKGMTALSSLLKGGRAGLFWVPPIYCSSKKIEKEKKRLFWGATHRGLRPESRKRRCHRYYCLPPLPLTTATAVCYRCCYFLPSSLFLFLSCFPFCCFLVFCLPLFHARY